MCSRFGVDSLRRRVALGRSGSTITAALHPTAAANPDALGANIGPVVAVGRGFSILKIS